MNLTTWLPIIMAVLSFFLTKKGGGSTAQAAGVAAIAGVGTYAIQNHTEWGQQHLSSLDGADTSGSPYVVKKPKLDGEGNKIPKLDEEGNAVLDENGKTVYETETVVAKPEVTTGPNGTSVSPPTQGGGLSDYWKSLGVVGQSAVGAGVGAVAAKRLPSWVLPAGLLLGTYLLLKD